MLVQVKKLQYWKTEHQDINGCQDACEVAPERGLFAVADGAGTTLFPALWAHILARHFVDIPLMSDNPFEVEWWVRLAQDEYKVRIPNMEQLHQAQNWSVLAKAQNQGSDSTLATIRISAVTPASAKAELLVFGDSCVIIGNKESSRIEKSFVLQRPEEFNQAPICVPSTLRYFNRDFNRCTIEPFTLQPHHVVIIASDAVSKWILAGGSPRNPEPWDAFQKLRRLSESDWPEFIRGCRERREMIDDDATALILTFQEDGHGDGIPLAATNTHDYDVIRDNVHVNIVQKRKEAFEQARSEHNNEMVAINYGDGKDLGAIVDVSDKEIEHARHVANALKEVIRAFRQAQNSPDLVAKMDPVWRQYGQILQNEKCAENIRETLQRNGIHMKLQGQHNASTPDPPAPVNSIAPMHGLPSKSQSALSEQTAKTLTRPLQPSRGASVEREKNNVEQEKKDLELNFLRALHADNDEGILMAVEAINGARARFPDLPQFTPNDATRIERARSRKMAWDRLQQALQSRSVEEIEAASDSELIAKQRLTPDEQKQIDLAHQLAEAFRNDDESTILTLYRKIQQQHQPGFVFTQAEQARIELAEQRLQAFAKYHPILKSGRLSTIAAEYNLILDSSKRLNPNEWQLVALAQEFAAAFKEDDDESIINVCNELERSSLKGSVAYTEVERERIERAKTNMQVRSQAVAVMNKQDITLEELRKVSCVKAMYVNYRISIWQERLDKDADPNKKQAIEEQIQNLQGEIHPEQLHVFALEDIIDDKLIQEKIVADQQPGAPLDGMDIDSIFPRRVAGFKQKALPTYELFLKTNRVSDDDVKRVIILLLRRELFTIYYRKHPVLVRVRRVFSDQLLPLSMKEWLEMQRKKAGVVYVEHNDDPGRRGQWLADQLQQIKW